MRSESRAALALVGCALAATTATSSASAIAAEAATAGGAMTANAATTAAASTSPATPTAATAPAALKVVDAWIRWLPANLPSAGYATLENGGDAPIVLTGASSPYFGDVSLHRTMNHGGDTEMMMPVEKLVINPHSSVNFAAAGYHMMLMQPATPIKPGDHVPIILRFADGSSMRVEFDVRKPDAT
jgi:copper(I)-binding protein